MGGGSGGGGGGGGGGNTGSALPKQLTSESERSGANPIMKKL